MCDWELICELSVVVIYGLMVSCVGIGPAKLSEMRRMTYERIVHFGDSCEVSISRISQRLCNVAFCLNRDVKLGTTIPVHDMEGISMGSQCQHFRFVDIS